MENKYLALGSIVTIKNDNKKYMIIGINQTDGQAEYDYSAVLYPFGLMDINNLYLFNNYFIDNIIFEGYMSSEYDEYVDDVTWYKQNHKKGSSEDGK